MGARTFLLLKADIERELGQLDRLKAESDLAVHAFKDRPPSTLDLRGIGSILHDFYSGIERVFERIASELDGELPHGEDWHGQLLDRMSSPVESVRPQVIGAEMARQLRPYLRFRHLFRNVYGFELRWDRCRELAEGLGPVLGGFRSEVDRFSAVLMALYRKCES